MRKRVILFSIVFLLFLSMNVSAKWDDFLLGSSLSRFGIRFGSLFTGAAEACISNYQCASGMYCEKLQCKPKAALGQSCIYYSDCRTDLCAPVQGNKMCVECMQDRDCGDVGVGKCTDGRCGAVKPDPPEDVVVQEVPVIPAAENPSAEPAPAALPVSRWSRIVQRLHLCKIFTKSCL
ncbi:hypothetical protein HZB00_01340 [Candidatus Woesearchaeota archaeon]|nr:hypothetical protein [Candidatus Woesearchaeota archaeon]